jgi:hypothetical protein
MRALFLSLGLLATAALPLAAQAPRALDLGQPTARHADPFGLIGGLRERQDGSVLIADPTDGVLRQLDRSLQRATVIGRTGSGPGEYQQPDAVWALPNDSTLLVDLGNNRLVRIGPDNGFGTYRPIMAESQGGRPELMLVNGVDARGQLYFRGMPGPGARSDSLPVQRATTDGSGARTVAMLKGPETKTSTSGGSNDRSQNTQQIPLSPADGWAVSRSGLLFVVRAGDYHVEVITPTGAVVRGTPVGYQPVPITEPEKAEYLVESRRQGGLSIGVENNNGQMTFSLGRGAPRSDQTRELPWPEVKPPFNPNDLWVDGLERLWVRRHQAANQPPRYDIFTPSGERMATVTLGANRRVVGMGEGTVYVARNDDDDLQYLERYQLPR